MFCCFTTVLLHCSILAGIAWFCFEAHHSFSILTTDEMLLEVDRSGKIHCYYLLSYGLSLTIVAISSLINPSAYTKNDFCVLMEANALFYITFVVPVVLFIIGSIFYTFLSWMILCRKSRTSLKNKEHTRLANVRFDIRCYFVFLLLLIGDWMSAYYYLRRAKQDDYSSSIYGYLFVSFNTLMGLYIFVFHCIQNEKIRREYGKYVRKNSWLPHCLRCSKTSISSGIVGTTAQSGILSGTITTNSTVGNTVDTIHTRDKQKQKSKLSPIDKYGEKDDLDDADNGTIQECIISSADCELNSSQIRRSTIGTLASNTPLNVLKNGALSGKMTSLDDNQTQVVVLERCNDDTVGSLVHTPSVGQESPTSSVNSSKLIFNQTHKQKPLDNSMLNDGQEVFYHQPDYYSWKQGKQNPLSNRQKCISPQHQLNSPQTHEFFYWTQKHNQYGKKKRGNNNNGGGGGGSSGGSGALNSPNGSLNSRTTVGSQILFYPSYKKTTLKNQTPQQQQQQFMHYNEAIEPLGYYQQQQKRHPAIQAHLQQQYYQQQQQQISSDDEQMESHARLLHLNEAVNRNGIGQQLSPRHYQHHAYAIADYPEQRLYRNKQFNCDFIQQQQQQHHPQHPQHLQHPQQQQLHNNGIEVFYNQSLLNGSENGTADSCPVYEEIMSNRSSDIGQYDIDLHTIHNHNVVLGGGVGIIDGNEMGNKKVTKRHVRRKRRAQYACDAKNDDDDDDDDDEEDNIDNDINNDREKEECNKSVCDDEIYRNDTDLDEENLRCELDNLTRSDDRMRRLMELEDENFRRRFQRQQRKNTTNEHLKKGNTQTAFYEYNIPNAAAHVGSSSIGGGGGGSVRSYKKSSPNGRLAVNELFNHAAVAPPLPPANILPPIQKRQTPQKQQLTNNIQQQQQQQQQPIGRNISAMLDENNTVRCYLEPLDK